MPFTECRVRAFGLPVLLATTAVCLILATGVAATGVAATRVPETGAPVARLAAGNPAGAAVVSATGTASAGREITPLPLLIRANPLIGKDVQNATGEHLGRIEEMVVDVSVNRVAYAVLSFGGIAGIGGKLFAVPWNALDLDPSGRFVVLDVSREALREAPGFDPNNWPDMANPAWKETINRWYARKTLRPEEKNPWRDEARGRRRPGGYYQPSGYPPYRYGPDRYDPYRYDPYTYSPYAPYEPYRYDPYSLGPYRYAPMRTSPYQVGPYGYGPYRGQDQPPWDLREVPWARKLTDMIGLPVEGPAGERLGELEEILIDTREGRLAYGLVSFGGFLDMGESTAIVPWTALILSGDRSLFFLDADMQELAQAKIGTGGIEQYADSAEGRVIHKIFGQEPYWKVYGYDKAGKEVRRRGPWAAGSPYNRRYRSGKAMTVSGTVESVGTFFPAKGVEPGLRLRLATKDGTVRVYAGPAGYARLEGFRFHYGDRIRVTGVEMKTDSGPTIQAGKIELDGKTLLLRSAEGAPLWTVPGRTPESGQGYRSKGEGS